jgi:hypothetical protein
MSPLDQLVTETFRPHAARAVSVAVEQAAEQLVKELFGEGHFKQLFQQIVDGQASSLRAELLTPVDTAINRAVAVAFEQGLSRQDIAARLRASADRLESGQ